MKIIIRTICLSAIAAVSLLSCSGCSEKPRELPDVPPTSFERYSKDITFFSRILNESVVYSVYLPASYNVDKEKRYPVVYMLHGYGDNNNSWNGNYLHANEKFNSLEAGGLSEMIYVFPRGKNSYYCNQYDGRYNYMKMFINELIPQIDGSLRTIADRDHRSITGYSMGGFGAMALAEKNPDVFLCSAPLSMSFRTDEQYMAESQSGWNGQWGSIFGGVNEAGYGRITDYYKAHCPFYYFNEENRNALSRVKWFLTCGDDEEQLLIANDSLHVHLRDLGMEHEFRVGDGAHTSSYWMTALNEVLPMFDYYMSGGDKWAGLNMTVPTIPEVEFAADGTLCSPAFAEAGKGTGLFVVFDGEDLDLAKKAMAYIYKPQSTFAYIYLPCNLSEKSLGEWMEYYAAKHSLTSLQVLATGVGAGAAWQLRDNFKKMYIADGGIGTEVTADPEKMYYFATTDDSGFYRDNYLLYKSCKKQGAKFEYRVINGSGNHETDVLKSLEQIKSYIIY